MKFEEDPDDSDRQPLLQMSRANDDPFNAIRDEVKGKAEQLKVRHEKFQDLVKNVDTSSNQEFMELRKGLVGDVRSIDRKLKGLKEAVEVVEKNRSKFPLIKDSELDLRRQFISSVQLIVNDVKVGLEAPSVERKIETDKMMKAQKGGTYELSSTSNPMAPSSRNGYAPASQEDQQSKMRSSLHNENDRFIKDQHQQQSLMIRQQDANLEQLEKGVDRLHVLAKDIDKELKEQNIMLDEFGNEVDESKSKLDTVMQSLDKLLKSKDGCQIYTIVILTIIAVIMIALVIWT